MNYILAIDQGTTGSRAIIYDKNGEIIASAYEEFEQYFPTPGWVEHDPEQIWRSVNNTIQKVLRQIPSKRIEAIGITNQRETIVAWDRHTGEPLHNAIVWQCRRTARRCDRLKRRKGFEKKIRNATGLPVDAYFSATKIEWLLRNDQEIRNRAKKGGVCFGTTDSWIIWKLTGGQVHATDYTNASRTMLFNIRKREWDKDILKFFSIKEESLPKVKKSSSLFGYTEKISNLPAGIPITGVAGDQQAALFGQACFESGTMKNTYGTGSFMLLNTGKKLVRSKRGLITTIGCDAKGNPCYVLEGAIFVTGAAIQWLRDGLGLIQSAAESEQLAESVDDNNGVYFVPAFVGLGAPYWDSHARGNISGITRGTTSGHILRAALEAMCYQSKDVFDAMKKEAGLKVKKLRVDGGAAANNFLCRFQADILGIEIVRPKVIESTSLGVAYLAGLYTGYWKNAAEIKRCWQKDAAFKPSMSEVASKRLYKKWKIAVKRACLR